MSSDQICIVNGLKSLSFSKMDAIDQKCKYELDNISSPNIRWSKMKDIGILSDCSFFVTVELNDSKKTKNKDVEDGKLFKCHKMILAGASSVFERMFYGGLPEESYPIKISDTTPEIFNFMLNYIYTHEINEGFVTFDNLSKLLYIGKKYMLNDFVMFCVDQISLKQQYFTPTGYVDNEKKSINFYTAIEAAFKFDNIQLLLICYEFLQSITTTTNNKNDFTLMLMELYRLNINYVKQFFLSIRKLLDKSNMLSPNDPNIGAAINKYMVHRKIEKNSKESLILKDAVSTLKKAYTYK